MKTVLLWENINQSESIQEFNERLNEYMDEKDQDWLKWIQKEMKKKHLSFEELQTKCIKTWKETDKGVEMCSVTRSTLKKWLQAPPKSRDNLILLCIALELTIEETNTALVRFARSSALYPKNPCDAIYIYMLEHKIPTKEYYQYKKYLNKILEKKQKKNIEKRPVGTQLMTDSIIQSKRLEDFLSEHIADFFERNQKLDAYIREEIVDDTGITGYLKGIHDVDGNVSSPVTKMLSYLKSLSKSSLVPDRDDLISLGIGLGFSIDGINEILKITYNEALCPKHTIEATLIYALKELELMYPSIFQNKSFADGIKGVDIISEEGGKLSEDEIRFIEYYGKWCHHNDEDDYIRFIADYVVYIAEQTDFSEEFKESNLQKKMMQKFAFTQNISQR